MEYNIKNLFNSHEVEQISLNEKKVRNLESKEYMSRQIYSKTQSFLNFEKKLILQIFDDENFKCTLGPILDAGCGIGLMTKELYQFHRTIYAIDFSEESLQVFKENLDRDNIIQDIHLIHGSITHLKFENNFFSAILSLLTFQHMPEEDRKKALREFHRTLAPGGVLICTVFNSAKFAIRQEKTDSHFSNGNPYYSFTRLELFDFFENEGFQEVNIVPLGIFLFFANLNIRGIHRFYRTFTYIFHKIELWIHHPYFKFLFPGLLQRIKYSEYWLITCRK